MNLFPDDHRSVYSTGRTVSRLRDFDDFSMDSPYSGRRPSSHTAYIPQPTSPGSLESSPRRTLYGEHHLPSFHHDHLHHQEHDQLGINTLQPNTQRRERAREALIRRNLCDFNVSVDSAATNSVSSRTGTTEVKTDQTVVQNFANRDSSDVHGNSRSNQSLHSNQSGKSEDPDSVDHLSSEENLSHESYDLLEAQEEEAQINTFSENIKTVLSRSELSFDNSISYTLPASIPHTPSRTQDEEDDFCMQNENECREDINSNVNSKGKMNSHSSTHSSRLSINSSGMSTSPLPDSNHLQEPVSILNRRRSSGSGSQKSKSSKGSKSGSGSRSGSRLSLKESLATSQNCFEGHEIHMEENISSNPNSQYFQSSSAKSKLDSGRNGNKGKEENRSSGMHETLIFQSPTNIKYFSSQISPQPFNSRTLPGKKRREQSPIIFTRGKLSVDCSSNSSSSHASPRISRPKSLDFSVVALHDLPRKTAYSYRDDTIDQNDFEDSSSALSVQNELNYASSSDVPPTPENPELPVIVGGGRVGYVNAKTFTHCNHKQGQMSNSHREERIYDIPEGIERMNRQDPNSSLSESADTDKPKFSIDQAKFKSYLEISGKFSSEDSESVSNRPVYKPVTGSGKQQQRVLTKVSSTESESNPSNNSVPAAVQFDSDTLSLPLDLLSPPMESESSTAMVDSESLPAPPQFGSNKDDTDVEEDATPKGEDITPDSLDICTDTNTMKKKKKTPVSPAIVPENKPVRQESTYETRAEAILESQSTIESFNGDVLEPRQPVSPDPIPVYSGRRESVLLRALDTFDSFNLEHEFPITRRQDSTTLGRQESTYEDRAEAMLEKQLTTESFTSQNSIDDNVFVDHPMLLEAQDSALGKSRDTVLESQSTFESFTTECEVLITKREESTYEERAEALLESQNTIDSFTTEVPNDDINEYDMDNIDTREDSVISVGNLPTIIGSGGEIMIADMYVRQVCSNDSVSTNGESEFDAVPFIDDGFDPNNPTECTCDQDVCYGNIIPPPMQLPESVYLPPTRSSSGSSFDCPPPPDLSDEALTPVPEAPFMDFPISGPYDMDEPPEAFSNDDFGTYILPPKPLIFRDGFHGPFPQRTLSRISEKSSNESASPQSDGPAVLFGGDNTSVSDQDEPNYTTSEDNENAPSISSDLPENMANPLDGCPIGEDIHVEYNNGHSPVSSNVDSPKVTEFTQIEQDTIDEDLDDTNAEEIKTEERISPPPVELPPDTTSISSENNATNKDSEGSLHDSMEILEDVNTIDHFENDEKHIHRELLDEEYEDRKEAGVPAYLVVNIDASENSGRYVVNEGSEELMF